MKLHALYCLWDRDGAGLSCTGCLAEDLEREKSQSGEARRVCPILQGSWGVLERT